MKTGNYPQGGQKESAIQFEIAEVQFNNHAGIVEMILECGNEFFYVFAWLGKQNSSVFLMEFTLEFFRYEFRVSNKHSVKIRIELHKYLGAVGIGRREADGE